jgi:PPOX class probable F420-dependent enzyme
MTAQFPAEVSAALAEASYIYLTTYSPSGNPGTVPTWCWLHEGAVYFTTRRASLKARRIARDGHVTVHVGRKDGPAFAGDAALVEDRPDLEAAILEAYRRKYWILIPLWMGRYITNGLRARTSVLVRIVPRAAGA